MAFYELQAGRLIMRDGERFCNLAGCVEPKTGNRTYDPVTLDRFARDVVERMGDRVDTGCQAIVTAYHGPRRRKGSRIRATAASGFIEIPFTSGVSAADNHYCAALALMNKQGWTGTLISGGHPDGHSVVHTIVHSREG